MVKFSIKNTFRAHFQAFMPQKSSQNKNFVNKCYQLL